VVLRRLAIFVGGFRLEEANAMGQWGQWMA